MQTWFVAYEYEDELGKVIKDSLFIEARDVNGLRSEINVMQFDHARKYSDCGKLIITTVNLI
ncbi:hypothetical protein ACO03_04570 [Pantoea ananatis]|nr:hypothetical protein ACO03_04570 [Pantoea ananatis]